MMRQRERVTKEERARDKGETEPEKDNEKRK